MAFTLTAGLAISAVKALIRFRGRVDMILALQEASAELPFALPPAPIDTEEHFDAMVTFFEGERGQLILELRELGEDFARVRADPDAGENREARRRIFQVFYEATDVVPARLGPDKPEALRAPQDMRLAFYVVGSERLSKNPVVARVLLSTADTLLEFAGEHAGALISDPKVAGIVETVLDEFAIKHDFDDASARDIFEKLLGAAIVAVTKHGNEISDAPAVGALVRALSEFRDKFGDDAAAEILSMDGFAGLLGTFAIHVADDPDLQVDDPRLAAVLSATLREIGDTLPAVLHDPSALLGVLEVTLTAATGQVASLLEGKLANKPLIPQVLIAVATELEARGKENRLLKSVADGEIVGALFRTTLATIAANPEALRTTAKVDAVVATLVTQVADVLAHKGLGRVFTTESLREIAARGLAVLADNPEVLEVDAAFASKIVVGMLKAASSSVADGLTLDDLETLAGEAVRLATDNLRLLELDDRLVVVVDAAGTALSGEAVRKLLSAQGRRDVLFDVLGVVAANPIVWDGLANAELVQPLVKAVVDGLATDPSKLLSGPALVSSIQRILLAAARRGKRFVEKDVEPAVLQKLLAFSLKHVEKQVGESIDGVTLPAFLERVVLDYLRAPFELKRITSGDFKSLMDRALQRLDAA